MTHNGLKRLIARISDKTGISSAGFKFQQRFLSPFIRAVNYHVITSDNSELFEKHLEYYSSRFVSVDIETLEAFISTGAWPHSKPGLILSFDDGHETHRHVAAPLLEKFKFKGWFFVPIGLMRLDENRDLATTDSLTADDLRYLDRYHIVGSHGETHCPLGNENSEERLKDEILGSKVHLENLLGHSIDVFCWVGGEENAYSREAAALIQEGYKYSFMTNLAPIRYGSHRLHLQRTNVEASHPLSLVKFHLSGVMDIYYSSKRRRVDRMTSFETSTRSDRRGKKS